MAYSRWYKLFTDGNGSRLDTPQYVNSEPYNSQAVPVHSNQRGIRVRLLDNAVLCSWSLASLPVLEWAAEASAQCRRWRVQWQPSNLHHSNASLHHAFLLSPSTLSCPQVHVLLAHLYSQNFWSPSTDIRPQQLGPCSLMLLLFTSFFSLIHFFLSVLSPIVLLLKLLLASFLAWLAFHTSSYNRLLTFPWPSPYDIQCTLSSGRTVLVGVHVCFARSVHVNCFLCKTSYCRNICFLILLRLASAKYHSILSESLAYRLYICSPNTEPSQARRVCLTTVSFRLLHTIDGQALVGKEHRAGYSLFNTHSSPRVGDLNWKILEISCKEGLKLKMEQLRVIHFGWRLTLGSVGANKWSTMFKCALGTLLSGS